VPGANAANPYTMETSPLISRLIESLRVLPGIGPKSARRIALYLLERNREGAQRLAQDLIAACEKVGNCQQCRNLSEQPLCPICANSKRDASQLCIVENPIDVQAIESATDYRGKYFVLLGHLSPLDGIGPKQLGLDVLQQRFANGVIEEVIIATNPTVEGEATAHYLSEMLAPLNISVSRIAHGVPIGGELEFIDSGTLSHAFLGRQKI